MKVNQHTDKSIQKEEKDTLIKTAFESDIICFKCGTVQSHEGLLQDAACTNCGISLIKELF